MSKQVKYFYEFGRFRLSPTEQQLLLDGVPVQLAPKTFETLVVFVHNNGHLLTKDELMRAVWADTFVEENNLEKIISLLRKTLGSNEKGESYIETIRRRGYRFAADVTEVCETDEHQHSLEFAHAADAVENADRGGGKAPRTVSSSDPQPEIKTRKFDLATWLDELKAHKISAFLAIVLLILVITLSFTWIKSLRGDKRQETRPDMTTERVTNGGDVRSATLSPDGKYFVYAEQDGSTSHLWLRQTGQGNPLEIIPPAEHYIYGTTFSPDGQFIYYVAGEKQDTDAALYRVPTLGGVQTKLLTKINSPVTFSPDGTRIAFVRYDNGFGSGSDCHIVVASSNGGDEKIMLTRKDGEYLSGGGPSWSPDGSRIAYGAMTGQSSEGNVSCEIDSVDVKSGAIESLSSHKLVLCGRIAWTGDGKGFALIGTKQGEEASVRRDQVWYVSYPEGEIRRITTDLSRHRYESLGMTSDATSLLVVPFNRTSQIWSMDAGGDARTASQLTSGTGDGRAGIGSLPDKRIVYVARIGDHVDVWQMSADGTNQKQLTNDSSFLEEVRACADGRFLIFASPRKGSSHLFRIDADGSNLKQLTFGNSQETDSDCSPDGQWVAYSSLIASSDKLENSTLWKISINGGEPVHLTDYEAHTPYFSPDGRFISYISGIEGQGKIGIVSADGGLPIKVFDPVKNPELNMGSHWTPDSQAITYMVMKKNVGNIWLQPLNGDAPRPITNFKDGEIYNYAFSTDGTRLFLARGHQIRDALLIKNFR